MNIKVLLVDDEREFVDVPAQRLETRSFAVSTALSGKEAPERITEGEVDVVILDVVMPGMNGIETLREIKYIKPLIEVIMLTGHATVETAIEGMKFGACD